MLFFNPRWGGAGTSINEVMSPGLAPGFFDRLKNLYIIVDKTILLCKHMFPIMEPGDGYEQALPGANPG